VGLAESLRSLRGLAAKHFQSSFEMLMIALDSRLDGFSGQVLDLWQCLGLPWFSPLLTFRLWADSSWVKPAIDAIH
jgi:hypothetical protein